MNLSKFLFVLLPIFALVSCWTVNTDTRNPNGTGSWVSVRNKELKPTPKFDKNAKYRSLTGTTLLSYDCGSIVSVVDRDMCTKKQGAVKVMIEFSKIGLQEGRNYDCGKFPDSRLIGKCISYKAFLLQKQVKSEKK